MILARIADAYVAHVGPLCLVWAPNGLPDPDECTCDDQSADSPEAVSFIFSADSLTHLLAHAIGLGRNGDDPEGTAAEMVRELELAEADR